MSYQENVDARLLQKAFADQAEEMKRLKSGSGGGTSDGMEGRVSRLEQRADKLGDDAADIRVSLATLTERVSHLPGKDFIVKALLTTLTVLGAVILFADRIKALVGL